MAVALPPIGGGDWPDEVSKVAGTRTPGRRGPEVNYIVAELSLAPGPVPLRSSASLVAEPRVGLVRHQARGGRFLSRSGRGALPRGLAAPIRPHHPGGSAYSRLPNPTPPATAGAGRWQRLSRFCRLILWDNPDK